MASPVFDQLLPVVRAASSRARLACYAPRLRPKRIGGLFPSVLRSTCHKRRASRRFRGEIRRARPPSHVVRMVIRRAIPAVRRADPVAALITWIAAFRRIVVPFVPIQFAVAAGAAAELVDAADHPAAAGSEEDSSKSTFTIATLASARSITTASRFAATARFARVAASARAAAATAARAMLSSALANRRTALTAASPCLPREPATIDAARFATTAAGLARARSLAAATSVAAAARPRAKCVAAAERQYSP